MFAHLMSNKHLPEPILTKMYDIVQGKTITNVKSTSQFKLITKDTLNLTDVDGLSSCLLW